MARDRANIRTDIWNDDDFRELSGPAQLLYLQLLTSATLTYAGVADWRPKRIASLSAKRTANAVDDAAAELVAGLYIVVDEDTEEVLIRSFLKHDGLLQKPNVTKAMVKAFNKVFSMTLKGVIVHELKRLSEGFPEWRGFALNEVQDLLTKGSVNPSELVTRTLPVGDASLPTTNYLLPTTDYSLPAPTVREVEDAFNSAWGHWPKKVERKQAFDRFKIAARRIGHEALAQHIVEFGDAYATTTERQFVPALGVWLNGERWTDELPQARTQRSSALDQNLSEYQRLYGGTDVGERSVQALDAGVGS